MKEEDTPKGGEEKTEGLTISKQENQIYQTLYLCEYLRELHEADEKEKKHSLEKKKDLRRHRSKNCK